MPLYELRSYKAPLLRGHAPVALEPADIEKQVDVEVGYYHDVKRGPVYEPGKQTFPGEVSPLEKSLVMAEAARLFSNPDCWHLTINEMATDAAGKELRSPIHWCASVEQVQAWLDEG